MWLLRLLGYGWRRESVVDVEEACVWGSHGATVLLLLRGVEGGGCCVRVRARGLLLGLLWTVLVNSRLLLSLLLRLSWRCRLCRFGQELVILQETIIIVAKEGRRIEIVRLIQELVVIQCSLPRRGEIIPIPSRQSRLRSTVRRINIAHSLRRSIGDRAVQ